MTGFVKKISCSLIVMLLAFTACFAQDVVNPPVRPEPKPKPVVNGGGGGKKPSVNTKNNDDSESKVVSSSNKKDEENTTICEFGGHEWVDLGLPSGLKWATCNIGSQQPELFGSYFSWGDISTKSSYDESSSKPYKKSVAWLNKNGYLDSNGNLTLSYDAARQQWGFPWRMPSASDFRELLDNTTAEWSCVNGINGWYFRSKSNGNAVFFPVAGWYKGSGMEYAGQEGRYWSSTPDPEDITRSIDLYLYQGHFAPDNSTRHRGRSVRAVAE